MSLVRRPVFLLAVVATFGVVIAASLRIVPVLSRHDFTLVGGAMYVLAAGTLWVVADAVLRGRSPSPGQLAVPVLVAVVVCAAALAYLVAIGGSGTPTVRALTGPAVVAGAVVVGAIVGRIGGGAGRVFALVLAVAVAGAGIALTRTGEPEETGGATACSVEASVEYCAYDGYEGFVEHWAAAVEPVRAQVPQAVRSVMLLVTQRFDRAPSPAAFATPKTDWGRGSEKGVAELALALDAANWAVGLRRDVLCDPTGQGRGIVAWWLAGQVSSGAAAALRSGADVLGSPYADPYAPDGREIAAQLLRRPPDEVGAQVRESWTAITSPTATVTDVAGVFGLSGAAASGPAAENACR